MNRWNVYEFLKRGFMITGTAPNWETVFCQFSKLEEREVLEGIAEFEAATKEKIRSAARGREEHAG
ncbi:hypothetical protein [Paenibacillus chitinolyticus]|uniref:hypothetical protein n=1 Tax=Paenibacillus chitinolyticus TaxID=79263 RepID=UPI00365A794A